MLVVARQAVGKSAARRTCCARPKRVCARRRECAGGIGFFSRLPAAAVRVQGVGSEAALQCAAEVRGRGSQAEAGRA